MLRKIGFLCFFVFKKAASRDEPLTLCPQLWAWVSVAALPGPGSGSVGYMWVSLN